MPLLDVLLDVSAKDEPLIHAPLDASQCVLQIGQVRCCRMLDLAAVHLSSIHEARTF